MVYPHASRLRVRAERGLTLIELLITISVLAVITAIAIPVISNVVASSNRNTLTQSQADVNAFIAKYSGEGAVAVVGQKLVGYADKNGDNIIQDPDELVETLTLDGKYVVTSVGTNPTNGALYSTGGITHVTVAFDGKTAPNAISGGNNGAGATSTPTATPTPTASNSGVYAYTSPAGEVYVYKATLLEMIPGASVSNDWSATLPVLVIDSAGFYAYTTLMDGKSAINYFAPYTISADLSVRVTKPDSTLLVFSNWQDGAANVGTAISVF